MNKYFWVTVQTLWPTLLYAGLMESTHTILAKIGLTVLWLSALFVAIGSWWGFPTVWQLRHPRKAWWMAHRGKRVMAEAAAEEQRLREAIREATAPKAARATYSAEMPIDPGFEPLASLWRVLVHADPDYYGGLAAQSAPPGDNPAQVKSVHPFNEQDPLTSVIAALRQFAHDLRTNHWTMIGCPSWRRTELGDSLMIRAWVVACAGGARVSAQSGPQGGSHES